MLWAWGPSGLALAIFVFTHLGTVDQCLLGFTSFLNWALAVGNGGL